MGLLRNRDKAHKAVKIPCPHCGKPNPLPDEGAVARCQLCNGVLPSATSVAGRGIQMPGATAFGSSGGGALSARLEAAEAPPDDSGAASYDTGESVFDSGGDVIPTFAHAPQGRGGVPEVEGYVPFDMNALEIGEPSLPRPSASDS